MEEIAVPIEQVVTEVNGWQPGQCNFFRLMLEETRTVVDTVPRLADDRVTNDGRVNRSAFKSCFRRNPQYLTQQERGKSLLPYRVLERLQRMDVALSGDELERKAILFTTFMDQVVPRLFLFSANSDQDGFPSNRYYAVESAIQTFLHQILTEDKVRFFSMLCPPYHYKVQTNGAGKVTPNSPISHLDGQMLPTIGPGFEHAVVGIQAIWQPLIDYGIPIEWTIFHYSGELGMSGLVEVGKDVVEYYAGDERQLIINVNSAYIDLCTQAKELSGTGMTINVASIESLKQEVEESMQALCQADLHSHLRAYRAFFAEREIAYLRKQGVFATDNAAVAALKEASLYYTFQMMAFDMGWPILDIETTADYMTGAAMAFFGERFEVMRNTVFPVQDFDAQNLIAIPVIMLAPYNPASNYRGIGLRQPFNPAKKVR